METKQPDWLDEPCPSWCEGDHSGQQFPADRRHQTELRIVPVVERNRRWRAAEYGGCAKLIDAGELHVLAVRDLDDADIWVVVANDQQRIEVSLESARRLVPELVQLLKIVTT